MFKIYAIIGIVFAVICGLFYWYFSYSQAKIALLNKQVMAYEIANEEMTKVLEATQYDAKKIQELNQALRIVESEDYKRFKGLSDTLSKLDKVHTSKAGLLERLINTASRERNRCFEIVTGATPIKNEKNRICPQLLR
jgi:hypothetical protein